MPVYNKQKVSSILLLRQAILIWPKVYIFVLFHLYMSQQRSQSSVLGKCHSIPCSVFVWFIPFQVFLIMLYYKIIVVSLIVDHYPQCSENVSKYEQRCFIKIQVVKEKKTGQCHTALLEAYGRETLLYHTVARWAYAFHRGREDVHKNMELADCNQQVQ